MREGDLAGLTGLKVLALSKNGLSTLPDDIFSDLTSLETLSLWDNNIMSLPAATFDNTTSLKWLSLRDNLLTDFPQSVSNNLSGITKLHLGGNTFSDETKQRLRTDFGGRVRFVTYSKAPEPQDSKPQLQMKLISVSPIRISEVTGSVRYTVTSFITNATLPILGAGGVHSGFGLEVGLSLGGSAVEGEDYDLAGPLPIIRLEVFGQDDDEAEITITPTKDFLNDEGIETIAIQAVLYDGIDIAVPPPIEIELHDVTNSAMKLPAPGKPHLVATGNDLVLTWDAPQIAATQTAINDYDIQYRIFGDQNSFTKASYNGTETTYTLGNLRAGMPYEARIRAKNPDGASVWSAVGGGSSQRVRFSTLSDYPVVTTSGDEKGTIRLLPDDAANAASVQFIPRVHKSFSIHFNYDACYDDSRNLDEVKSKDYYRKGVVLMIGKPIETYLTEGNLRTGHFAGLSPDIQRRGIAVSFLNYEGHHTSSIRDGHGKLLRGQIAYNDGPPSDNCQASITVSVNSLGLMRVIRSRGNHHKEFSYQMARELFDSLEGTNIAFSAGTGTHPNSHSVKVTNVSGFLGQNGNSHDKWWELW